MSEASYDVVVIGAGVGGLATAALMARRGRRPLVLEQGEAPGGGCATLARRGYRFDAAGLFLSGFDGGDALPAVLTEVGASVDALPLDPGLQVALPRHRFGFHRADSCFWREIRREFPRAEPDLRALLGEVRALDEALRGLELGAGDLPPSTPWARLRRWGTRTKQEGILQRRAGESLEVHPAWQALPPDLQRALGLALRHLGQVDPSAPLLVAASVLGLALRGFSAPRGGTGALIGALRGAVERRGGRLRAGARAVQVLLRGRRAVGVRLADGSAQEAPAVVAAVAPAVVAGQLLPEAPRTFRAGAPTPHAATFTLYLGVDEEILPAEMGAHVLLSLPEALQPGGIASLSVSASPAWDSGRAPKGNRALTVNAPLPLGPDGPAAADWVEVGERVLGAIDDFMPGLRRHLNYCEVRSPTVWQEQTGRPYGAAAYVPGTLPVFLGWQGFPHATSVPGLYVAGDWTFPGGGVAAVAAGARRTADLVLAGSR